MKFELPRESLHRHTYPRTRSNKFTTSPRIQVREEASVAGTAAPVHWSVWATASMHALGYTNPQGVHAQRCPRSTKMIRFPTGWNSIDTPEPSYCTENTRERRGLYVCLLLSVMKIGVEKGAQGRMDRVSLSFLGPRVICINTWPVHGFPWRGAGAMQMWTVLANDPPRYSWHDFARHYCCSNTFFKRRSSGARYSSYFLVRSLCRVFHPRRKGFHLVRHFGHRLTYAVGKSLGPLGVSSGAGVSRLINYYFKWNFVRTFSR